MNSRILFACLILFHTACKNQLDKVPISQPNATNFYRNEKDVESAVTGAYNALKQPGQYGRNYLYFMEVRSDNTDITTVGNDGGIWADIDLFRTASINTAVQDTWNASYVGIQRCNIVLNRIDNVEMSQNIKSIRKAEMKFLRALTYFNLVRIFGDVPLVLNETTDPFASFKTTRSPASKVYDQILKDVNESIADLPAVASQPGRVTKAAALMLLAKVLITNQDFSSAEAPLRQILSGPNKLMESYSQIFGAANKNNVESIFEIQYKSGLINQGSAYPNYFTPPGKLSLIASRGLTFGDNRPTADLYGSFENGDVRRDVKIGSIDGQLYPKIYVEVPLQANDSDVNLIVYRVADAILLLSEVLNEKGYFSNGEAFSLLNQIRKRAGLNPVSASDIKDQAAFRLAIEKERRAELAMENDRWFDLLRTGRALSVMRNHKSGSGAFTVKDTDLLFPVPQSEIDNSGKVITQNPGY